MKHTRVSLTDIDGFVRDSLFGDDIERDYQATRKNLLGEILSDNLTDKQKLYIMMYYKKRMTMEEIAAVCGVSKSTVSRTIVRGRERILSGMKKQALRRLISEENK